MNRIQQKLTERAYLPRNNLEMSMKIGWATSKQTDTQFCFQVLWKKSIVQNIYFDLLDLDLQIERQSRRPPKRIRDLYALKASLHLLDRWDRSSMPLIEHGPRLVRAWTNVSCCRSLQSQGIKWGFVAHPIVLATSYHLIAFTSNSTLSRTNYTPRRRNWQSKLNRSEIRIAYWKWRYYTLCCLYEKRIYSNSWSIWSAAWHPLLCQWFDSRHWRSEVAGLCFSIEGGLVHPYEFPILKLCEIPMWKFYVIAVSNW